MTITTARDGHVALITFARGDSNFADLDLLRGLGAAFDAADADPRVRAIVIASKDRVFCAGADLANANPVEKGIEEGARNPFYVAAAKLFAVKKPVVAAVQGAAVGAGLASRWSPISASPRRRRSSAAISFSSASIPASASRRCWSGWSGASARC